MRTVAIAAGMVLLLPIAGCAVRPSERALVVVGRSPIVSLDPLANDDYYAHLVFRNAFDALVTLDAELRLVPALAVSWSNPSELLWQFELRQDVRFHDTAATRTKSPRPSAPRSLRDPDRPRLGSRPSAAQGSPG